MLRAAALRVTRPRLAVLGAVHDHSHADTDAIIRVVRARPRRRVAPGGLRRAAGADPRRAGPLPAAQGSVARYEARVGDNHHHVVCRSCGTIADVDCVVGEAPCLTADGTSYAIDEAEVIFWGAVSRTCARGTRDGQRTTTKHRDRRATDVSEHGSESENPVIAAPEAEAWPPAHQPGLVAEPAEPAGAPPALAKGNPLGEDFSYAEAFADARRRGAEARRRRGDDDLAGLVARRLRPLRAALHPDELALGRHLPHRGRPRRRRRRRRSASRR